MRGETFFGFTVAELARRWRVSENKVRAWIRAGILAAINTSDARCRRPRFVVTPEAVAAFECSRHVATSSPAKPKRKRKTTEVNYYPD
jgi:hypothetical protein